MLIAGSDRNMFWTAADFLQMVVSQSGEFIGSVAPGGNVTNFDAVTIGFIKANGFAYNEIIRLSEVSSARAMRLTTTENISAL